MSDLDSAGLLKAEMKAAVREHRKALLEHFPSEHFYGYSLYASDDVESIGPVANSETAIRAAPSHSMFHYYRFNPDEWNYWDDFGTFDEVNRIIATLHNQPDHRFGAIKTRILLEALACLQELEGEGVFGPRTSDRFVVVWLSDSSHPIKNDSARRLNSDAVYQAYASALVTPSRADRDPSQDPVVTCVARRWKVI